MVPSWASRDDSSLSCIVKHMKHYNPSRIGISNQNKENDCSSIFLWLCVFLIESICSSKQPKERNFSDWWTILKQYLRFQSQHTKSAGGKGFTWGKQRRERVHGSTVPVLCGASVGAFQGGRNTLNSVPANLHFVLNYSYSFVDLHKIEKLLW